MAVLVVVLLLAAGGPVLDARRVEAGVNTIVAGDLNHSVSQVTCPDGESASAGTTFTCTATVDGRPARPIPVTVTDDTGDYDVGAPR